MYNVALSVQDIKGENYMKTYNDKEYTPEKVERIYFAQHAQRVCRSEIGLEIYMKPISISRRNMEKDGRMELLKRTKLLPIKVIKISQKYLLYNYI